MPASAPSRERSTRTHRSATWARGPYVWDTGGHRIHGVSMAVDLGNATAQVTVSAHDVPSARSIADLVQGSLQKLS